MQSAETVFHVYRVAMWRSMQESHCRKKTRNQLPESRTMRKYHVRFGGGRLEKEPKGHLVSRLPNCGRRISERKGTVMYCLKTATARVEMVLKGLGEGVDLAASERIFGHSGETIRRWLTRAGMHSEGVHEEFMVDVKSEHVQLDELKVNMKGLANQWLWVAIDAKSKVLLSLQVGPRKQWVAHALVHSLVGVMAPGYVPLYTSDGLAMYFYALTAHYGSYQELEGKRKPHWVVSELLQYAQMKKHRVWRKLKRIEIRVLCGEWEAIKERLLSMGLKATVQTSFVERV